MKNLTLYFALIIFFQIKGLSQTTENNPPKPETFSAGADLVSRYIWRGIELSHSPAIQPTLSLNIKNFSIGAWGSYTFAVDSLQEADLFVTYSLNKISFTIYDYYNPIEPLEGGYFEWKSKKTGHTLEGIITIDGPEVLPVQFVAGVFFYGNDLDENGKNYYSSYFEINRTWENENFSIMPFIGISPSKGYYSNNGFQVVNLGTTFTKSLKITPTFELPLKASFVTNPHKGNAYLVLSLSF